MGDDLLRLRCPLCGWQGSVRPDRREAVTVDHYDLRCLAATHAADANPQLEVCPV